MIRPAKMLRTEEEVRRAVAKRLGKAVPDDIWELSYFRTWVHEILEEARCPAAQEEMLDQLAKDEILHRFLAAPVPTRRAPAVREVPPDRRLEALSCILAAEADRLPEVQTFRREVLGGKLLAPEDVSVWVAEQVKDEGQGPEGGKVGSWEHLSYAVPGDEWRHIVPVREGVGVLGRLKALCNRLRQRYPLWQESQAVSFVLCRQVPLIPKARVEIKLDSHLPPRIILNLDPRLSKDEVARIYACSRAEVFRGRDRPMGERNLALAVFVAENEEPGTTWATLMARWNQEHPEWAYRNRHLFARDARASLRRITGRTWVFPRRRPPGPKVGQRGVP